MNTNGSKILIAILILAVIGLGVYVYREETKPDGVEIKIGQDGVSVKEN